MEGKAILFKAFADVDAVPIVLASQDVEQTIQTIKNIAPTFGGINLEDFKAPECFVIEERLKKELNIPVFHDDQHGTAIVALAGLLNSLKLTGKNLTEIKIVVSGAGAAGIAIVKLLALAGVTHVVMVDSKGAIHAHRDDLNPYKSALLYLNKNNETGALSDVIRGADVFMGLSQPRTLTQDDVRSMAPRPVIFAMANPIPEIMPEDAIAAGAYIVATGRSDYPNQLNNVLVFPGMFRGALDAGLIQITDDHKLAAAHALADYVTDLRPDQIIPSPLDKNVASVIAEAVKKVG
jgi:malate dehydrogenase (oxaloacetate-decarboxylating)